jgi:hypothetical protein
MAGFDNIRKVRNNNELPGQELPADEPMSLFEL